MDSQLKQRLIGAAVLVALAVIFLPMLIKGPAPDSGVSDVPLDVPNAPDGNYVTRDLPLVVPDDAPPGGVTGATPPSTPASDGDALPMVDTANVPNPDAADLARPGGNADASMLPAAVAGGDYAVHVGAYASSVSADTVVSRLRGAKLPASSVATEVRGAKAWRVSVGPYASRADAETTRIEVARVTGQSSARVIALDADAATPAAPVAAADKSGKPAAPAARPEPAKPDPGKPDSSKPEPVAAKPEPPKPATPAPTVPAASGVGFAVQIGAFGEAAQANAKRDQLRAAGFSAFTETVNTDKGTLTRVLAGPVVSRADADRMKGQIKAKLGVDGLVRSHP